jgi:hypothetical protein
MHPPLRLLVYGNALLFIALVTYFFIMPIGLVAQALNDPGLRTGQTPRFAFHWHQSLSKQFEPWARGRVASGRATELSTHNISGTEWPVFSSVFYLWTTEALQDAWEENPALAPESPAQSARGAIEAAAALVADPNHATWVKNHWGDDYLHHQNLFYRMLLISGLTSYQKLLGDDTYEALLQDQVETLAREMDESPFGLLDDYPGECYPIDILPAIAAIRRADAVLGTDHTAFVNRALRAFEGDRLDPATQLPAYVADSKTGLGHGSARGVGLSFMLIWAPELWPDTAQEWYARYEQHFWQTGWLVAGFREFPKEYPFPSNSLLDVDAGPLLAGYGTAASAFGIGATRVNGHLEQAYPLSAQALVAAWPLPDGTLLGPRLLSNLSDAPYVGEAALLFSLTRRPLMNISGTTSALPPSVYLALGVYVGIALACLGMAGVRVVRWEKDLRSRRKQLPVSTWQLIIWLIVVSLGVVAFMRSGEITGGLLLLSAQFLPHYGLYSVQPTSPQSHSERYGK